MPRLNISYLERDLKQSIENDIQCIALYHSRNYKGVAAGFFSIPRHVFCIVDYLGYISSGDNGSSKRAENFIKDYFPSNYHGYAELLITTWRHGTVHQYQPISYFAEYPGKSPNKITVRWLSNNSNSKRNRNENLKTYSVQGKRATRVYLVLNNCQLVDDLLYSLSKFISDIKKDPTKIRICEERIQRLKEDSPSTDIDGANRRIEVAKQIKYAWDNRSGLIDEKGSVVQRFP